MHETGKCDFCLSSTHRKTALNELALGGVDTRVFNAVRSCSCVLEKCVRVGVSVCFDQPIVLQFCRCFFHVNIAQYMDFSSRLYVDQRPSLKSSLLCYEKVCAERSKQTPIESVIFISLVVER